MSDLIRQNSVNLESKAIPMASKLTLLLLLTVVILSDSNGLIVKADETAQLGGDCNADGFSNQKLSYHAANDEPGWLRCCLTVECPAGTEAKVCDDHATTSCVDCPPGTHQSSSFYSYAAYLNPCVKHRQCDSDSRVLQEGNSTANTVCECNVELGYYGQWPNCYRDKTCPIGFQLHLSGECKPCPQNFHRSSENYTQCIPCSVCNEATQNITSRCAVTHDTICSTDSTKVAGGLTAIMVVVFIAIVVVVILVFACICYKKRKHREGTIVSCSTSSISSNASQEERKFIPSTELPSTGICDLRTNEIYGQNHVPYSASLCDFKAYGCGGESSILNREVENLLQNYSSLSQTNQSITPESESSIIDLRENYETEEEQDSQARGAEQNVTMNGGQNIYGRKIVINFYQQDKPSCDVKNG